MAAPVLEAKGTASRGTTSCTPGYTGLGTISANDIIFLAVIAGTVSGQGTGPIVPPSGFRHANYGFFLTGTLRHYGGLYWKRATGSETGTETVSWTGGGTSPSIHAQLYRVSGCPASGMPWEAIQGNWRGNGNATITYPGLVLGGAGRTVLAFVGQMDDTPGASLPSGYADSLGIDVNTTDVDTQLIVFDKTNTSDGSEITAAGGETHGWFTVHVALHDVAQSQWEYLGHRGFQLGVNDDAPDCNPNQAIPVGSLLIVGCASDNLGTTDADSTEHTISDNVGNTYTKLFERRKGSGTTALGVVGSLWATKVTTEIGTGDAITLTMGSAVANSSIRLEAFALPTGKTFSLVGGTGTSEFGTTPSVALSGLAVAEHLFLGFIGLEIAEGVPRAGDRDYYPNSDHVSSGSGGSVNGLAQQFGLRALVADGDTFNPTVGGSNVDTAAILVALDQQDDAEPPEAARGGLLLLGVGA